MPGFSGGGRRSSGTRGGFDPGSLFRELTAGRNDANEANERRFQEGLDLLDRKRAEAEGFLEGQGASGLEDIQLRATQDIAASGQDLASRGLSGTTVGQGNARAIRTDATRSGTLLNERINSQRLNVLGGIDSERLGFLERKTEEGPDFGSILPFIAGLGRGGGDSVDLGGSAGARQGIVDQRIIDAETRRNAVKQFGRGSGAAIPPRF